MNIRPPRNYASLKQWEKSTPTIQLTNSNAGSAFRTFVVTVTKFDSSAFLALTPDAESDLSRYSRCTYTVWHY